MHPILFTVGGVQVYSYGLFYAIGLALTWLYFYSQRRYISFSAADCTKFLAVAMGSSVLGSGIGWVLFYGPDTWSGRWDAVVHGQIGFSFYHGFWALVAATYAYCRLAGKDVGKVFDTCAVSGPLTHASGRIGCLLNGCCYGKWTTVPWGIVYGPDSGVPWNFRGMPVHPTQLYEFFGNLFIAGVLHQAVARRTRKGLVRSGAVFWIYVLLYALMRFITDPFRGEDPGRLAGVLTTGQWDALISGALGAAGLAYALTAVRRRPTLAG